MILVCLGVSLNPGYNLCQYPLNFGIVPSVTSAILENRFQFQWNLCVLFRSSFISFLRINWLWTAKYCEILQCRLNSEANNQVVQLKIFGMFGLVKNKPFNEKKMIFFCLVQFLRVRCLRTAELLSLVGVRPVLSLSYLWELYVIYRRFCVEHAPPLPNLILFGGETTQVLIFLASQN